MSFNPTTKIKFGAVYSKKELEDVNIDPIHYMDSIYTISISQIENTDNYIIWASDSFIEITNKNGYISPIRPILKLYTKEKVFQFIEEINSFVIEKKLPQKLPEALIISEYQ